ncbi:MAG: hypothetical protein BMS9Abin36_1560 [Gammaproteobacteria bacterium]|nr:MAG: hypothetical protein BMS9Abin36_1560 [Gammaproteobacteria bacterium]
MSKNIIAYLSTMLILVTPVIAEAKPRIKVTIETEKIVTQVNNGKTINKRVKATSVEPGETLIYTLRYINNGDEKATNVKVDNPIPKGSVYVAGSAKGINSDITFSVDGGKTFKKASLLTYRTKLANGKTAKKKASPEQYSNIRWLIQSVAPGQGGTLGFRVIVK